MEGNTPSNVPTSRSNGIDVEALLADPAQHGTAHTLMTTLISHYHKHAAPLSAILQHHSSASKPTTQLALTQSPHADAVQNLINTLGLKTSDNITPMPTQVVPNRKPGKRGRPRKAMKNITHTERQEMNVGITGNRVVGETGAITAPGPVAPSKKRKIEPAKPSTIKKGRPKKKAKLAVSQTGKAGQGDGPARFRLPLDLWQRVLEFCPPSFLVTKARLVSKTFKEIVDERTSIIVNCRLENYGFDMPACPQGLTERQYNDLLGAGRGCMDPGCKDQKACKTYWSWNKRWCMACWKKETERELDIKHRLQRDFLPQVVLDMLDAIPWGLRDSWGRAYPLVEDTSDSRASVTRVFRREDVDKIAAEYKALTPPPYVANPDATAQENTEARAAYDILMFKLPQAQDDLLNARKATNKTFMARAFNIEGHVIARLKKGKEVNDAHRAGRKDFFMACAKSELSYIPEDFVNKARCYRAACRIYRNAGTDRSWRELKHKLMKEWSSSPAGQLVEQKQAAEKPLDNKAPALTATSQIAPQESFHNGRDLSVDNSEMRGDRSQVIDLASPLTPVRYATHGNASSRDWSSFRRPVDEGQALPPMLRPSSSGRALMAPMIATSRTGSDSDTPSNRTLTDFSPINSTSPLQQSAFDYYTSAHPSANVINPVPRPGRMHTPPRALSSGGCGSGCGSGDGAGDVMDVVLNHSTVRMRDVFQATHIESSFFRGSKRRANETFSDTVDDLRPSKRHTGGQPSWNLPDRMEGISPTARARHSLLFTQSQATIQRACSTSHSSSAMFPSKTGVVPFFQSTGGPVQSASQLIMSSDEGQHFPSHAYLQTGIACSICHETGCSEMCEAFVYD